MMTSNSPKPVRADITVIGGGINGTAIAREAALRGLHVVLVERRDLAAEASAWNSRMIHGGIRYLEHAEFRLVYESLHERERLLRAAPHLVKPYPLLIPFYRHNHRSGFTLSVGMFLYDLLSIGKSTPNRQRLDRERLHHDWPGLTTEGLRGGGMYFDAQVAWAERLSVENALSAVEAGAVVRTHVTATEIMRADGHVIGVQVDDELDGTTGLIESPVVINATGANIDSFGASQRLIGGTKGTHILVDSFPGAPPTALHYEAVSDGRAVLVLPWEGRYLIGATDVFVDGDPAEVRASDDELNYLLAETNRLIPAAGLTRESIVWSYVGVRPLPYSPKAGSSANVSRDHVIHRHRETQGLWSIIGGKLTTHRALGEQTLDVITGKRRFRRRRGVTRDIPLPGGRTADWKEFCSAFLARSALPAATAARLLDIYGTRAESIEAIATERPVLAEEIAPHTIAAEIANAFENEFARTLADVLLRRTMTGLARLDYVDHARAAARVAAEHGYIRPGDTESEVQNYLDEVARVLPAHGARGLPTRGDDHASRE